MSDNTRMSDHCIRSGNVDSGSSELCADDTILDDKCVEEDDSVSQYSINHISQTDNELSFLDNDGWLNIGNFEDVDRMMLSCDLTFGMESLNNEEFCWPPSSHGTEGSDDALKSEFKFSSAEASPLKSISDYNIDTNENMEGLPINDRNNSASLIDKKLRSQMNVNHDAGPSLSTFYESDMKSGNTDDLMAKLKMQGKLSKPSAGKRKNSYLGNGDSDHPYAQVEQYVNMKQPFGASSSGITSQDSVHKHRPDMDSNSLGHIHILTDLRHPDYSHISNYTSLIPTLSGSRSELDGQPSPSFKESSFASNMESSRAHNLEAVAFKTQDERENFYLCHDEQLLSPSFKSENMVNPVPFKSPSSDQKVGHQFESENEGHSEVGGVSIGFSQEIDSLNVQESSSMSSAQEETSLEATSFLQLQQIMDQYTPQSRGTKPML